MAFGQPNYYGNPYYGSMNYSAPQIQQPPMIYGKIVDGIEVVKSIDVPLGTSFILPKADGTACYCKGWNNDGTTFIKEYQLVDTKDETPKINWNEKLDDIYDSIDALSKKIDKIKAAPTTTTTPMKRRKVGDDDE